MTKFVRENFRIDSGYITYGDDRKFVARMKTNKSNAGPFITFMIKHFTVEEYFNELASGKSPLPILEAKGFILPHIKKWLRNAGYTVDAAGYKQLLADQVAKHFPKSPVQIA